MARAILVGMEQAVRDMRRIVHTPSPPSTPTAHS